MEHLNEQGKINLGAGLNFTGRSPGFSIAFKCTAEHLNEQGFLCIRFLRKKFVNSSNITTFVSEIKFCHKNNSFMEEMAMYNKISTLNEKFRISSAC